MVEQAIQMATQPASVYRKMQAVFALYEEGKLKDQKVHQMTGRTLQKAIEGRFAPNCISSRSFKDSRQAWAGLVLKFVVLVCNLSMLLVALTYM